MIVTLTLSLHSYAIGFAYHFCGINISPKFDKDLSNSSGKDKDVLWTDAWMN